MKYKSVLIISILLLHGHPVHGGEPLHDLSGALVLVRVTVVLLQVDGELSDFHVIEEIQNLLLLAASTSHHSVRFHTFYACVGDH